MFTRLVLLSVSLVSFQGAAFGQALDPGPAAASGGAIALPAGLERRLAAIEEQQNKLLRIAESQGRTIEQIAAQDETGAYHWRFNGNSQPARQEFSRAIESSIPAQGRLVVNNFSYTVQWIGINGDRYRVSPRRSRELPVPPGLVVTKLDGEAPKTQYLGHENKFAAGIDINDTPRRYIYESPIIDRGWVVVQ